MEKKCQQLGVNLRVIPIASRADFSDELKNALYLGGELVGGTQVIACFHGGGLRGQDRHELEVANGGAECVDTLDFLSWVRTAPEGMPCERTRPGSAERSISRVAAPTC